MKACDKCGGRGQVPTGQELRAARKWLGMTLKEMAAVFHYASPATIAKIETERQAPPVRLIEYYEEHGALQKQER